MKIFDVETKETVEYNPKNKLTKENVLNRLNGELKTGSLTSDFLMKLSFYMGFAISTKDLSLIKQVHDRITYYFLDCCYG